MTSEQEYKQLATRLSPAALVDADALSLSHGACPRTRLYLRPKLVSGTPQVEQMEQGHVQVA